MVRVAHTASAQTRCRVAADARRITSTVPHAAKRMIALFNAASLDAGQATVAIALEQS